MMVSMGAMAQVTITGVVRDPQQRALEGATVQVAENNRFAVTDAFGRFELPRLAPGDYQITVRYVGFTDYVQTVSAQQDVVLEITLTESTVMTDEVIISATRATDQTPTTHSSINRQAIQKQNFGQDLPFLLNWMPSVVTTSDAGAGVGYTGIRIRGSDATRINVTINGIPYNDAESLNTFWVDIPDIAGSSQSIQVQRGVGTSTNGGGAFGASINLQTNTRNDNPYAEVVQSYGSFNTQKSSASFGTGLLSKHWVMDGRISKITSDGFIDRASSDLSSYYFSLGYYAGKTMMKAIVFGGKERTYQAWYGVPESRLKNDEEAMELTAINEGWNAEQLANLLQSGSRTFNPYTYEDQVDDYRQDHYQLHFSHRLNDRVTLNAALHLTPGKGYYEEFKYDADLEDYGLAPVVIGDSTIESMDLVRRRWLDNKFYGTTFSVNYETENMSWVTGGAWNRYDGDHFGEIIWSEVSVVEPAYRYYSNYGDKRDFNIYSKLGHQFGNGFHAFIDLQYRQVDYETVGIENEQNQLDVNETFRFFNPKAGISYNLSATRQLYASYSVAHREPVRDDFVDFEGSAPRAEKLGNLEVGFRSIGKYHTFNANYYWMDYRDQLVLTGELNDVGAYVRTNAGKSYRMGIELEGAFSLSDKFILTANATLSRNKIATYNELLVDYGPTFEDEIIVSRKHKDTDIALSPSLIAATGLTYRVIANGEITWLSKYVGKQYLDNTSRDDRSIDAFFVNDIRLTYTWKPPFTKEVVFSLLVNNVLDFQYESNGYTWGYLGGGAEYRENYFYPQAGRNFMAMIRVRIGS
jgi:iron complex outermembrane receptor protein